MHEHAYWPMAPFSSPQSLFKDGTFIDMATFVKTISEDTLLSSSHDVAPMPLVAFFTTDATASALTLRKTNDSARDVFDHRGNVISHFRARNSCLNHLYSRTLTQLERYIIYMRVFEEV